MSASPGIKRVLEISRASYLRLKDSQLVVEQEGTVAGMVPGEDLGIVLIDDPAVVMTAGALAVCWQNNAPVVLCDHRHIPGAILLPFAGHTLHTATLSIQVAAGAVVKKRLWKEIVAAKLRAQAGVLCSIGNPCTALERLAGRVASGDSGNLEAQGARLYWRNLFPPDFRRNADADDCLNGLLNYGYAVLRATVARAICAAGMHPALGIKHSNQYNAFCLADDLMEPLRPLVDARVHGLSRSRPSDALAIDRDTKRQLLEIIGQPLVVRGQSKPLLVAVHEYAASVRGVLAGEEKLPAIPSI